VGVEPLDSPWTTSLETRVGAESSQLVGLNVVDRLFLKQFLDVRGIEASGEGIEGVDVVVLEFAVLRSLACIPLVDERLSHAVCGMIVKDHDVLSLVGGDIRVVEDG